MTFSSSRYNLSPPEWARLLRLNGIGLGLILLSSLLSSPMRSTWDFLQWAGPLCLVKRLTHLPCPTCGLSRGFIAMHQGNWQEAFRYNILSPVLFSGILGLAALTVLSPAVASRWVNVLGDRRTLFVVLALLALAWGLKWVQPSFYW